MQPHPHPVRDPRYGKALFDFYQNNYFRSITDIMVAQARSPISKQGSDPELLLGSLYLSYGMRKAAADIFGRLLSGDADPYAHDLAWFYLGRMRYMDGEYAESLEAFKSISGRLPEDKDAERFHLMVNAYLHGNDYDGVIKILDNISGKGIWRDYARYNLGIALIRSGRVNEGIGQLEQLSALPPGSEEEYTLRDKAEIAVGYASMRNDTEIDPVAAFSRVRLNGPFSEQALLGLGWAYDVKKRPQEALRSWMELGNRSDAASASQEALIAVAYTLEQLKRRKLALSYYEKAVSSYDQVRAELDKAISEVDYGKILRKTVPAAFAADDEWTDSAIQLSTLPVARYLSDLLTSRDFQRAYRDYLDLNYIRLQVVEWNEKIPLLKTMLEERRRQYIINVTHTKDSRYAVRLRDLHAKRDVLANELADIEDHEKTDQLITREERGRLNRLQGIKSKLDTLAGHGLDVAAQAREYRILYGLQQWQLHTEFPIRLWRAKKGLHELDKALAQADRSQSSLQNTLKISPLNFDGFSQRISSLERHLRNLDEKLGVAAKMQERYCSRMIVETLEKKRREVASRRNAALYAQARLFDQLSHEADAP